MKDQKTTNILLLLLVIPVVFYILKTLHFIFIPLVFSMFIALLFLPLMRWLSKRGVHKYVSIFIVLLIFIAGFKIGGELLKITSREILETDSSFFHKLQEKANTLIFSIEDFLGISVLNEGSLTEHIINKESISKNVKPILGFVTSALSKTLLTAFFVILLLAESINFQKLLNEILLKQKFSSIKTFMKIESDLIKFVKVKFFVSALTGLGFGLACYFFDVSFPIFWGLFAFFINFIQMIGSVVSVVLLSLFAFVEIEPLSVLLFFMLTITLIQLVFGGVLEPILLGKSFSINIITILIMLSFWGYIWGIPGLILAIPITVFLKIIFEQFPQTKILSKLISGNDVALKIPQIKKNF